MEFFLYISIIIENFTSSQKLQKHCRIPSFVFLCHEQVTSLENIGHLSYEQHGNKIFFVRNRKWKGSVDKPKKFGGNY